MFVIKNLFDLTNAISSGTVDFVLNDWLQAELQGLWEHLGQGEPLADFDLTTHGAMWVATPTDRKLTWREITRKMGVLVPEFIEIHTMQKGQKALRVGFLADNDYMPILYALTDCLNPQVVERLEEEAFEGENNDSISGHPYDGPF